MSIYFFVLINFACTLVLPFKVKSMAIAGDQKDTGDTGFAVNVVMTMSDL